MVNKKKKGEVDSSYSDAKHVRFSNEIITHVIEIEDRKGYWTEDKFRFQQRCASVRNAISFIFEEVHRRKMRLYIVVNYSSSNSRDECHQKKSVLSTEQTKRPNNAYLKNDL